MADTITKDTLIGEIIQMDEGLAPILLSAGMHCLGCPSAQMESIADAAAVHGINPDELLEQLNNHLASK